MKETRADIVALLSEDIARVRAAAAELNNKLKALAAKKRLKAFMDS